MKKAALFTVSAVLWATCIALVALVWLEYVGGYALFDEVEKTGNGKLQLHKTTYYGHLLEEDPYKPFSVQHVHPFYLFSLPWTPEGIAKANMLNAVVSLGPMGYRNSLRNSAPKKGVVFGGSAAFGVGASGDQTTLASALNTLQANYEFLNYGVPSWNSHQEMVAYTKVPFKIDYVIAFSGSNDFIVALRYCRMGYEFPAGSPESFEHLAAHFDDVRGEQLKDGFVSHLFPQTRKKISQLFGRTKSRQMPGSSKRPDCRARIVEAAEAFIANQRVVADLASLRGAGYLLALQPHADFLLKSRDDEEAELRRIFYRHVMDSAVCQKFQCIDLSRSFAGIVPLRIEETPDHPNRAIFADKVHLTDNGYASVAELLVSAMRRQFPLRRPQL